jgi:hemerythrin
MEELDYPDLDSHRQRHEELTEEVQGYRERYASGEEHLSTEIMYLLRDWLKKHIQEEDRHYGPFFKSHGV